MGPSSPSCCGEYSGLPICRPRPIHGTQFTLTLWGVQWVTYAVPVPYMGPSSPSCCGEYSGLPMPSPSRTWDPVHLHAVGSTVGYLCRPRPVHGTQFTLMLWGVQWVTYAVPVPYMGPSSPSCCGEYSGLPMSSPSRTWDPVHPHAVGSTVGYLCRPRPVHGTQFTLMLWGIQWVTYAVPVPYMGPSSPSCCGEYSGLPMPSPSRTWDPVHPHAVGSTVGYLCRPRPVHGTQFTLMLWGVQWVTYAVPVPYMGPSSPSCCGEYSGLPMSSPSRTWDPVHPHAVGSTVGYLCRPRPVHGTQFTLMLWGVQWVTYAVPVPYMGPSSPSSCGEYSGLPMPSPSRTWDPVHPHAVGSIVGYLCRPRPVHGTQFTLMLWRVQWVTCAFPVPYAHGLLR